MFGSSYVYPVIPYYSNGSKEKGSSKMPADGYHRVFEGREIPGNLESPAIYTYQCWTCLSVWRTEAEAAGCAGSHNEQLGIK